MHCRTLIVLNIFLFVKNDISLLASVILYIPNKFNVFDLIYGCYFRVLLLEIYFSLMVVFVVNWVSVTVAHESLVTGVFQ